jgi:hypothetical protein
MEWFKVTVRQDSLHTVWATDKEDAAKQAVREAEYEVEDSLGAVAIKTVRASVSTEEVRDIITIKDRLDSLVTDGVEEEDNDSARQAYISTLVSVRDDLEALVEKFFATT